MPPRHVIDAIIKAREIAEEEPPNVWRFPPIRQVRVREALQPAIDYIQENLNRLNDSQKIIDVSEDRLKVAVSEVEAAVIAIGLPINPPICLNNRDHIRCNLVPPGTRRCDLCGRRGGI